MNGRHTRTCLLILLLTLPYPALSKHRKHCAHLLMDYHENGENIKLYTWYYGSRHIVQLSLKNYNRGYEIVLQMKGGDGLAWLTQARFVRERDFAAKHCMYEAITDTSNHIFSTTSPYLKYKQASLTGASRIYLTPLEQDLLAEAIHKRIDEGPEKPDYYGTPIDPHAILFFICVPKGGEFIR